VDARGDEVPWLLEDEHQPNPVPVGRSEWRNANYALHAACWLAAWGGLDVGRQESFWHLPLGRFASTPSSC
jgi:hypothetical protein